MAEGGQARVKIIDNQGIARTQSPTNKNYALELPTFGVIVGVNPTGVQWKGLTLEELPSWSQLTSTPGKYALYSSVFWPRSDTIQQIIGVDEIDVPPIC